MLICRYCWGKSYALNLANSCRDQRRAERRGDERSVAQQAERIPIQEHGGSLLCIAPELSLRVTGLAHTAARLRIDTNVAQKQISEGKAVPTRCSNSSVQKQCNKL